MRPNNTARVNGISPMNFRDLRLRGRCLSNQKIRCAINGLGRMLGGVCTDLCPSAVDKSGASKTCNFSVAWTIDVCDQGLGFAVQTLCTGVSPKSVDKRTRLCACFGPCCSDWERCALFEVHQGLGAVFNGLRTGLSPKSVDKLRYAERFALPKKIGWRLAAPCFRDGHSRADAMIGTPFAAGLRDETSNALHVPVRYQAG